MEIQNLFPQPVATFKLGRDLTLKELTFIKNQEKRPNIANHTSVNTKLLQSLELTKLRDFIENSVSEYFEKVHNPKDKVNLRITQSWANYTSKGEAHHTHAHPNSFVSGVFYPQANDENDKIFFWRSEYQQIKFTPKEWNVWNSESWWLPVGAGDLILFPSSLQHSVQTVCENSTRISIAFNTFPVGPLGEELNLTSLVIGEENGALRIS